MVLRRNHNHQGTIADVDLSNGPQIHFQETVETMNQKLMKLIT